jgi:hypothetical protein
MDLPKVQMVDNVKNAQMGVMFVVLLPHAINVWQSMS